MLQKLEYATKSRKVRIIALFAVLAIAAVVAVVAADGGYQEYTGTPVFSQPLESQFGYEEYVGDDLNLGTGDFLPPSEWYETYIPDLTTGNNQPGDGGLQSGYIQQPPGGNASGVDENAVQNVTPGMNQGANQDLDPSQGDLPFVGAGGDIPSDGYIPIVPAWDDYFTVMLSFPPGALDNTLAGLPAGSIPFLGIGGPIYDTVAGVVVWNISPASLTPPLTPPDPLSVYIGATMPLDAHMYLADHTFDGWQVVVPSALSNMQPVGHAALLALDAINHWEFVAVFTPITHPVSFDLNGGTHIVSGLQSPGVVTHQIPQGNLIGPNVPTHNPLGGETFTNGGQNFGDMWDQVDSLGNIIPGGPHTTSAVENMPVTSSGALFFRAIWSVYHPVTFALNGGQFGGDSSPIVGEVGDGLLINTGFTVSPVVGGALPPTPVTHPNGYVLVGWVDGNNNSILPDALPFVPITGPSLFTAQWRANRTVSFDIDIAGGALYQGMPVNPANITVPSGDAIDDLVPSVNVPAPPAVSHPTHDFGGWRHVLSGGIWQPASLGALQIGMDMHFEAVWLSPGDPLIEISFFLNSGGFIDGLGGIVNPSTVISHSLPATGFPIGLNYVPLLPVREGYDFAGWYEGDPNIPYDDPANLAIVGNIASRIGYSPFLAGNVFLDPPPASSARLFIARWNPVEHQVTFVLAGGTYFGSTANIVRSFNHNHVLDPFDPNPLLAMPDHGPAPLLHKDGYHFAGWFYDGSIVVPPVALSPSAFVGHVISGPSLFVASWVPEDGVRTVTFDLNGGICLIPLGQFVHPGRRASEPIGTAIIPEPYLAGSIFSHWDVTLAGAGFPPGFPPPSGSSFDVAGWPLLGDITLTAQFTPISPAAHTVTFLGAGGQWDDAFGIPTYNYIQEQVIDGVAIADADVPSPTLSFPLTAGPVHPNGYTFQGWQLNAAGQPFWGLSLTPYPFAVTGPLTFVASWSTPGALTAAALSFHMDPTDTCDNTSFGPLTGLTSVNLPVPPGLVQLHRVPNPTRDGQVFIRWICDDTGALYSRSDVAAINLAAGQHRHFTADFITPSHIVTFELSGGLYNGVPGMQARSVVHGNSLGIADIPTPPELAHPNGDLFRYWIDVNAGGVTRSALSISDMPVTGASLFIAVWTPHDDPDLPRVPVYFHLAEGFVPEALGPNFGPIVPDLPVGFHIEATNIPVPVRDNFVFSGYWYVLSGPALVDLSIPSATVAGLIVEPGWEFVAIWDETTVDVTFLFSGDSWTHPTSGVHYDAYVLVVSHSALILLGDVPHHLPVSPGALGYGTRDGYVFRGWQLFGTGESLPREQVAGTVVTTPLIFVADWVRAPIDVTFVLDDGSYLGSTTDIVWQIAGGNAIGRVPIPIRAGDRFMGWYEWNEDTQSFEGPRRNNSEVSVLIVNEARRFIAIWEPDDPTANQVSVTFVLNGGTHQGNGDNRVVFLDPGDLIGTHVPQPIDHDTRTFIGWIGSTPGLLLGHDQVAAIPVGTPSALVFVAQFDGEVPHPVTFMLNGGNINGDMASVSVAVYSGEAIGLRHQVPLPVLSGTSLQGWEDMETGDILTPDEVHDFVITGPRVFTALWGDEVRRVTFRLNGGTFNDSPDDIVNMRRHGNIIGPMPYPEREFYTFNGWIEEHIGGTTTLFSPAALTALAAEPVTLDRYFVARWTPNLHTVTFNLYGGNVHGNTDNIVLPPVFEGQLVGNAAIPNPVFGDAELIGWRVGYQVLTREQVAAHRVLGPVVFIAVWDIDGIEDTTQQVTFNMAGGTYNNSVAPVTRRVITNSLVGSAAIPAPTLANNILVGWTLNNAPDVLTVTQVAATVANRYLEFTAVWAPIQHPVTFIPTGGYINNVPGRWERTINQGAMIGANNIPSDPTMAGSVFGGWRIEGTDSIRTTDQIVNQVVLAPMVFLAVWDIGAHPVTFNLNGGNVNGNTANVIENVIAGGYIGSRVPVPVRAGHTLTGWTLGTQHLTPLAVAGTQVNGPLTFVAVWTPQDGVNLHNVTFVLNGGNVAGNTANIVNAVPHGQSIGITNVPEPVRAGFILSGWIETTSAVGQGNTPMARVQVAGLVVNGPRTFEARWVEDDDQHTIFTVIFNPSIGTLPGGESGIRSGVFGTRVDVFPTAIAPAGHRFTGWFYNNVVVNPPLVITRNMTLTAGFTAEGTSQMFTIVYNPAGGTMPTGVSATQQHAYGTMLFNHPVPTRAGHTFGGWTHNGVTIPHPLVVRGNMTLVAHWVPGNVVPTPTPMPTPTPPVIPHTYYIVAFNAAPGVHATATETGIRFGRMGAVITLPANPVRANHVFTGWRFPDGTMLTGQLVVRGNKTMTAVWTPVGATPAPSCTPGPGVQPPKRVNPQTSPLTLGFTVFGTVAVASFALMSIALLAKRYFASEGAVSEGVMHVNKLAKFNKTKGSR